MLALDWTQESWRNIQEAEKERENVQTHRQTRRVPVLLEEKIPSGKQQVMAAGASLPSAEPSAQPLSHRINLWVHGKCSKLWLLLSAVKNGHT